MKKIIFVLFIIFFNFDYSFAWDLYMGGDIMLSRTVGAKIKENGMDWVLGDYNPTESISGSLLLFNLESPFSNPDKDTNVRTFSFGANEKNIEVLNKLKGNNTMILTIANNHILNSGYKGLQLTIDTLNKNKINYVGVSSGDRIKYKKFLNNQKIYCINGYSYDGREYYDKTTKIKWYINSLNDAKLDLESMKLDNCDYKIMMFHWGVEYSKKPTKKMKELAYELIDNGLDLLIGSHSHVFGETEKYKNKFIFYSLGNYIFDQNWGKSSCQKLMSCIYDNIINKNTVPTYIGTGIFYNFISNESKISQFKIDNGKLTKYDILIGLVNYLIKF